MLAHSQIGMRTGKKILNKHLNGESDREKRKGGRIKEKTFFTENAVGLRNRNGADCVTKKSLLKEGRGPRKGER